MSKVLEEMKTRRSIRKFKPDIIPQDILDRMIKGRNLCGKRQRRTEHHHYSGDK